MMLYSKLKKPLRNKETLMQMWQKQLESSRREKVRMRKISIDLKDLRMTPKRISMIIRKQSEISKNNSKTIQTTKWLNNGNKTWILLKVKQQVWNKPIIQPNKTWPQYCSLEVRIECMKLKVLSILLTPTWKMLRKTSRLLKKFSMKLMMDDTMIL